MSPEVESVPGTRQDVGQPDYAANSENRSTPFRTDSGLSLRAAADAAGVSHTYLAQIEAGEREPSISALTAISEALGADLSLRLYPNTGPRIRDHIQARIVEELLRVAHPRWSRHTEVPVYRPARGRVDLVLHDPAPAILVATEVHSQIHRIEQQLGWAQLKADSLESADLWRATTTPPTVSRLLVLRSTRATRELAARFETTLRTAYPAPAGAIHAALVAEAAWPGPGILWADVTGERTRILDRPPRGVRLGR
jgi:transcriptional regulator with XRE-family HTH domain